VKAWTTRYGWYLLLVAGCATTLSRRGPVDDSVIMARHLCQRGLYASGKGQWDQAEAAFARAVSVCPTDQRARQHYADALWQRGAGPEAVEQMRMAVKLSGSEPSLVIQLGRMHLEQGQLAEALEQAGQALQSNRNSADAWALRSDVLCRQGKTQEALDSCHRALSHAPGDRHLLLRTAELYRELGRPRGALVALETLADDFEPGEEPAHVLYLQGLALEALGRHEDALRQLCLARDRAPPTRELLCVLAELELKTGDLDSARRHADEAHRLGGDDKATGDLLARLQALEDGTSGGRIR
jgi:tetratricopeptide (TPR) repeat protein